MKTENEIIDILYKLYQNQGYITEQEIFDLCDDNSLSFIETDRVCNKIHDLGILINDTVKVQSNDYSQIDYNIVFNFFYRNYPQMKPIVDYIKSLNPPQKGENRNLIIQMRSGNVFARKQLIEKNLRTALRISMNYADKSSITTDEIFSVACEGLISAVDSFDPYSNSYFASYSSLWIRQKIERYIIDNQFFIRIPINSFEIFNKIREMIEFSDSFYETKLMRKIINELAFDEL